MEEFVSFGEDRRELGGRGYRVRKILVIYRGERPLLGRWLFVVEKSGHAGAGEETFWFGGGGGLVEVEHLSFSPRACRTLLGNVFGVWLCVKDFVVLVLMSFEKQGVKLQMDLQFDIDGAGSGSA